MKYISLFLLLTMILTGCRSNTTQVIYTNDGKPGTIVGHVTLIDTAFINDNYVPINDASGVEVSIEGTSLSAVTGKDGRYSISNVPPGAYNFFMKKEGFVTNHSGVFEFSGNGTDAWDGQLYRESHLTPELILRAFEDTGIARFTFKVLDQLQQYEIVYGYVFFGKTENISPSDPASYLYFTYTYYRNPDNSSVDLPILRSNLLAAGFSSNETVHCIAFASRMPDYYRDIVTGKFMYSGFGPYTSGIKTFILP